MSDSSWTEPESAANSDTQPEYPYNHVTQTESGHMFEMDDTPSRERVRLHHRTGTFIEMHPNGDVVFKCSGTGYEIVASNKNVLIKGACNITIEGDSTLHIKGDAYTQVDGTTYQTLNGNVNQLVQGNCEQTIDGDFDINVSGDFTVNADNVNINSDLNVTGDVATNQSVAAFGNVTAGMNMSATLSVQTAGYMKAGVLVSAPLGSFTLMNATWMTDTINTALHNIHLHVGKVFSGPIPPMI